MNTRLSRRSGFFLIAIFLSLSIFMPMSLTAFAGVNAANTPGTNGSAYNGKFGRWRSSEYGARVTLVDADTGDRIPEYSPIDYYEKTVVDQGGLNVPLKNVKHFGKWCKSDYRADDTLIEDTAEEYAAIKPPPGFPRMLNNGAGLNTDLKKIKDYFGDKNTIQQFCANIGATYEEVTSGKYKFLVEPIVYISMPEISTVYAATITELGLWNRDARCRTAKTKC